MKIDGLDIFYRETGPKDAPVALLLQGFPTDSHMFRNLIPALADEFRPSYDRMASLLAFYGSAEALSVTRGLDSKIENLLRETAA
jgi:pimeloyl-ACP methyl ester carboxylesterase